MIAATKFEPRVLNRSSNVKSTNIFASGWTSGNSSFMVIGETGVWRSFFCGLFFPSLFKGRYRARATWIQTLAKNP